MPQVRCAQCGAINDIGSPDYPYCVGCGDGLAKCGFCQWFDDQTGLCKNGAVAGLFDVTAEATPPCDYHTPRQSVLVRSLWIWVFGGLGVLATLFILGYAVVHFPTPTPPVPKPFAELRLVLEGAADAATVGRPYPVVAEVQNESDMTAHDVRLVIDREFLTQFAVFGTPPGSVRWEGVGQRRALAISDIPPGGRIRVSLELLPRKPGVFEFVVQLMSEEAAHHGRADLPIVVEPATPAAVRGG